jgi:non-ribosomal peptide synthetase component F
VSAPTLPALGGPLADALALASPAAAQQLQQLAAPAADAAAKAAALQAQADEAGLPAEAAVAAASQDLDKEFSAITPAGQPAVPCACAECIGRAVDPAIAGVSPA